MEFHKAIKNKVTSEYWHVHMASGPWQVRVLSWKNQQAVEKYV